MAKLNPADTAGPVRDGDRQLLASPLLPDVIEGDPTDGKDKIAWFDDANHPVGPQAGSRCEALRALTR